MNEKELKASREKSQVVTNILNEDFEIKWDGINHALEKGKSEAYPYYLAEHIALHMARKWCTIKKLKYHDNVGKIVDKIMGKEFIEYGKLTEKEAIELCGEREIALVFDDGKKKNKATLIQDLKNSH